MRGFLPLAILATIWVAACAPVKPPIPLLRPGSKAVLSYDTAMLPERIEFGHDLLLVTEDAWGRLAVKMFPQRVRVGSRTIELDRRVEHTQGGNWQYVPGIGQPQEY